MKLTEEQKVKFMEQIEFLVLNGQEAQTVLGFVEELVPDSYNDRVRDFHKLMQPTTIALTPKKLDKERLKLRINLILEELLEFCVAQGGNEGYEYMKEYFVHILNNPPKKEKYSELESFDALIDLQYVVSGLIEETGFGSCFDEGFEVVHDSNMSKICKTTEEAKLSNEFYKSKNIDTKTELIDSKHYVVKRISDDKVLKSIFYRPATAGLLEVLNNNKFKPKRTVVENGKIRYIERSVRF